MPVYFIMDQMNALDHEGDNVNTVDNQWKVATQEYLDQLTSGHYQITSVSANYRMAMHMAKKQAGEMKLALMSRMSKVSKSSNHSFVISSPSSSLHTGQDETVVDPSQGKSANFWRWWQSSGRVPHRMHSPSPLTPSGLCQETFSWHRTEILDALWSCCYWGQCLRVCHWQNGEWISELQAMSSNSCYCLRNCIHFCHEILSFHPCWLPDCLKHLKVPQQMVWLSLLLSWLRA